MRTLLIISLIFSTLATKAHAWEITALGGMNYASPTERQGANNFSWTSPGYFSYGVAISEELFTPRFELESGLFSITSSTQGSILNVDETQNMTAWEIPILLRFHFDPWISLGIGGYYSIGQGTVDTFQGSSVTRQSYGDAGFSSTDEGLVVSLKAKLHFNNSLSLVIDSRYLHGLKNRALSSGDVYNTRSIQILGGFGYEFGD